ncbi:hypothetical protein [Frigoribacterium sp. RIT-PI-h]|uniref:hypothetical protein n=1 Tax=Frigoribacterium sp. RIT-PI-h TaxID=1690245 RepID=UPI00128F3D29|nr:hypothetical protein [Frigoribacterium sp. RIT-PI-h]
MSSPTFTPASSASAAGELANEIEDLPKKDRVDFFADAMAAGRGGTAKKTAPVTARPATVGEVVVSRLEGDGIETVSSAAEDGDMVVRSDCGENTETEILVSSEKFPTRYGAPQDSPDAEGYQRYLPSGEPMNYVVVTNDDGAFSIEAPWGEAMVVRPGDALVQNQADPQDIYRIYGPAFTCTYEITETAP